MHCLFHECELFVMLSFACSVASVSLLRTRLSPRNRKSIELRVPPRASAVKIPATYDELYARAASAAVSALGDGRSALELEFPATPSLSRAGDGSRASELAERASNARLAAVVAAHARDSGFRTNAVVFDSLMEAAVLAEAKGNLTVLSKDKVPGKYSGVLIAASPAAEADWAFLEGVLASKGASVVVCNGAFYNGLEWLDPAFHLKPCSGYGTSTGFLLCEYPASYVVVSARTGQVLEELEVEVLQQGRLRRPDFQAVSAALMKDYASKM